MGKVIAFAGGVGGAKLAHGLYGSLPSDSLTVIVNTADDFVFWGLNISPDLDTVMYTLAGIANEVTGWGVAGETWNTLAAVDRLQGETWFRIGDQDLATHLRRTEALRAGASLSSITTGMATALGIRATLLPMSDDRVATMVRTPDGVLAFQDYFVRRQHRDAVLGVELEGIDSARVTSEVIDEVRNAELIVFCPSNPIVSIGPILALGGMRDLIGAQPVPRIAVSPIVGGKALKGPADVMLQGLGHESTAAGVARIYQGLLTGIVIDDLDAGQADEIRDLGMDVLVTNTIMRSIEDRRQLANTILDWCGAPARIP